MYSCTSSGKVENEWICASFPYMLWWLYCINCFIIAKYHHTQQWISVEVVKLHVIFNFCVWWNFAITFITHAQRDGVIQICINYISHVFQYLQAEHASLRGDLKELVTENRHLSDKLKYVVSTKFKNESSVSPHHKKESNMLTNLHQQLSVVAQVSCFLELAKLYD